MSQHVRVNAEGKRAIAGSNRAKLIEARTEPTDLINRFLFGVLFPSAPPEAHLSFDPPGVPPTAAR
jgi:hypothetical protein